MTRISERVVVRNKIRPIQLWRKAYVTWSLVTVNVLWYVVVEQMYGTDISGIMHAGGLSSQAVLHGEWYRLISSIFVHASGSHLVLNMLSLLSLYIVELLLGRWVFLSLYLISGVAGNVLSLFILRNAVMCGASGAVMGLIGATIYLAMRGIFPKLVRNQLLIMTVVNILYGLMNPQVNLWAHLSGATTGYLLIYLYAKRPNLKIYVKSTAIGAIIIGSVCLLAALPV